MAKFCEGCPSMGACIEQITAVTNVSSVTRGQISDNGRSASFSAENGVPQGPTDMSFRFKDSSGGLSDRMALHGESVGEVDSKVNTLVSSIDACQGPTEVKRFFGLVTRQVCTVLKQ